MIAWQLMNYICKSSREASVPPLHPDSLISLSCAVLTAWSCLLDAGGIPGK